MKVISERCGICMTWRLLKAHPHCQHCGAYHIIIGHTHSYYNKDGVEMVRGVPMSLQRVIERLEMR